MALRKLKWNHQKKTSLHSPPPLPHPYRITLIKKHQSKKIIPSKLQLRLRHSLNDGKRAKYPLTEREVMPMVPNGRWNLEWKWKSRHFCFRKFNQSLGICFGVVLFDDFPWWLKWMMKAFYTIHLPPPVAVALLAATVFPFFYSFIIFFSTISDKVPWIISVGAQPWRGIASGTAPPTATRPVCVL